MPTTTPVFSISSISHSLFRSRLARMPRRLQMKAALRLNSSANFVIYAKMTAFRTSFPKSESQKDSSIPFLPWNSVMYSNFLFHFRSPQFIPLTPNILYRFLINVYSILLRAFSMPPFSKIFIIVSVPLVSIFFLSPSECMPFRFILSFTTSFIIFSFFLRNMNFVSLN